MLRRRRGEMIGRALSHFKILEEIGAGGMGIVYQGLDVRLHRSVAIKVLPPDALSDADRRERFVREARAASALNHPNIVTVYEIGSEDGLDFIAMELIEGRSLREVIPPGGLDMERALGYGIQIARGLAAAHEKGIVHRDLKPQNLLVSNDGRVKILDFGLAKLTPPREAISFETESPTLSEETEAGAVLGTIGYMSPEQVRGERADARSDVFALGAVLYEMLTGRRAFTGGSRSETINAILTEDPPDPDGGGRSLNPGLERVVRGCLRKEPRERFQSAADVALALEAVSGAGKPARDRSMAGQRAIVIGAGLLVLAGIWGVGVLGRHEQLRDRSAASVRSIAVLPLQNLSGDPEQEYFADGLTDALITDLAKARSLKVISRTSVMQYKGARKPLPEIAQSLGVEAVIEGSVLRSGDRVRVTAQLIDARADRHLWAEEYERDLRDVLALQRDIVRSIVREVHVTLTPQEAARLAPARRVVPASHEAYLKGRFHLHRLTEESIARAIGLFEEAIAADPLSAEAYSGLAAAHMERGIWGTVSPRETAARARAAARRALDLDGSLAEAHQVLGSISQIYDWDWATAERELRRAIELEGGDASLYESYAGLLQVLGRLPEAIAEIERARDLDPLSPTIASSRGRIHYRARQYDTAIGAYKEALELDPSLLPTYGRLADVYLALGRHDDALAMLENGRRTGGDTPRQSEGFAVVLAATGRRAEATEILARFKDRAARGDEQVAYRIALIETALGHNDEAIAWLERAYAERSAALFLVNVELKFDPLRADPRFQALLRRMNFPR